MEAEKLRKIAMNYYKKRIIQKALIEQAKNREFVAVYLKNGKVSKENLIMGKRPDTVEYENDIISYVEKNATSFHVSEELWKNPLELATTKTQQQINELRLGWDLILDVDSKYFEYSRIAASLLCEALSFHNLTNFGLKFSGRKGWHIGVSFEAFPKKIQNIEVRNFFPEGPKIIISYLKEMIKKELAERILEISTLKEISAATGKKMEELMEKNFFNPYSVVEIDTVLIAHRHLYRCAYSLNEISGLVSCVIKPEQLKVFRTGWARPDEVAVRTFLKKPEKEEALELLLQALDWSAKKLKEEKEIKKPIKISKISSLKEEVLPPCIKKIMEGMKYDGRKRALFIMINFYRSLGVELEEIKKIIEDWNKKNYKPLPESYIKGQLQWFKKQEIKPPPNCTQSYYRDLGICDPDLLCKKIKNPLVYVLKKSKKQKNKKRGKTENILK